MAQKRGPKPGAKIKPLSDRDKWNARKKSRGTDDDVVWKVVKGVLKPFKK
jgi:hypothetical protein